jgi:hypothetical protein
LETSTTRSLASGLRLRLPIAGAAVLLALLGWTHTARASTLHHAALVVEHSSGRLLTRCVAFVEDQITGFQLVQRSGLEYQAQSFGSMGSAICQLDYEPQDVPSSCFGSGAYWQYFHRTPSGWAQSSVGASSWALHDGDMDGWRYASGAGQTPTAVAFNAVCAPAATSASATAAATRRAAPTPVVAGPLTVQPTPVSAPTSPPPTAAVGPTLEALAPTASPSPRAALAVTGPPRPPPSTPIGTWLLLGGGGSLLVGLAGINLRRRRP